jgi:hypothetical protein
MVLLTLFKDSHQAVFELPLESKVSANGTENSEEYLRIMTALTSSDGKTAKSWKFENNH